MRACVQMRSWIAGGLGVSYRGNRLTFNTRRFRRHKNANSKYENVKCKKDLAGQ